MIDPTPIPIMSLDAAGNPWIAYDKDRIGSFVLQSSYWTGNAWVEVSNFSADDYSVEQSNIDIAFDSQNRPVLTFFRKRSATEGFIYVKRWNPVTNLWFNLATPIPIENKVFDVELEMDNNRPIIAFQHGDIASTYPVYVMRWNGSSWTSYGSPELNVRTFSLALGNTNNPVLAYEKLEDDASLVIVRKWNSLGSQWETMGKRLNFQTNPRRSKPPSIETDSNGNAVVIWSE